MKLVKVKQETRVKYNYYQQLKLGMHTSFLAGWLACVLWIIYAVVCNTAELSFILSPIGSVVGGKKERILNYSN